jgi:putative oxidoreductase
MKKFLFDCGTRDATASTGLLILRISMGLLMLLGHGLGKLQGYSTLLNGMWKSPDFWPFNSLAPQISLAAAIVAEFGASILLILGLMTRPAAFLLGFTMVVAAFFAHGQGAWFMAAGHPAGAKEPALLYLTAYIVLIVTGAGSWSMDSSLYREGKRKRW